MRACTPSAASGPDLSQSEIYHRAPCVWVDARQLVVVLDGLLVQAELGLLQGIACSRPRCRPRQVRSPGRSRRRLPLSAPVRTRRNPARYRVARIRVEADCHGAVRNDILGPVKVGGGVSRELRFPPRTSSASTPCAGHSGRSRKPEMELVVVPSDIAEVLRVAVPACPRPRRVFPLRLPPLVLFELEALLIRTCGTGRSSGGASPTGTASSPASGTTKPRKRARWTAARLRCEIASVVK